MILNELRYRLAQSPLVQFMRNRGERSKRLSSYSQHGEDAFIFNEIFGHRSDGIYVDLGASHPVRISNTWLMYRNGWHGVTVEPITRLSALHRSWRPRDVQVEALVGDQAGTKDFYNMYPSVLSTCSQKHYEACLEQGGRLVERVTLPQMMLKDIFDLAPGHVDFLSVDVEGLDPLVARQIAALANSELPRCVCIETFEDNALEVEQLLSGRFASRRQMGPNMIFWNEAGRN